MASTRAKSKARTARRTAKRKIFKGRVADLNLGKYMEEIKIGHYTWDDVLRSTTKNMDAVADANRAIIEGYSDIAKRQYEMLKDLLRELRKVKGDRDVIVRELKRLIERAKKDVHTLQLIASRTNSKAQRIVKRRAEANLKAWKQMVAEARKSVSGKLVPAVRSATGTAATPKKKAAAKRKTAPKKKAAAKKKVAAKRKTAPKKKVAPKRKAAPKKKAA